MKQTKQQTMSRLYDRLRATSEIPIKERSDIHSKGLYLTEKGKQRIYIKESLALKAKLLVLLHEYSHYVHLIHHYDEKSRAECEIIANGSAYLLCREYGLNIAKDVDLPKFNDDPEIITRLTATIQSVAEHIITDLNRG